MTKALLLLVVLAMIAVPARAARIEDPKYGLLRMIRYMLIFNAFYWFNLMFLYGRW